MLTQLLFPLLVCLSARSAHSGRRAAPMTLTDAYPDASLHNSHDDVEFPQKTLIADNLDAAIRQALGAVLGYVVDSVERDLIYLRGVGGNSGRVADILRRVSKVVCDVAAATPLVGIVA